MKRYKPLFSIQEKIYGNNAIVYHRTKLSDLINKVYTSGFKAGFGNVYGVGFYATYDLKNQQQSKMRDKYGDVIVKFQVSLQNFFILDYEEFIKSSSYKKLTKSKKQVKVTKSNFIQLQLDLFKIPYNQKGKTFSVSSYLLTNILETLKLTTLKQYVDGVIFSEDSNEKILICYDTHRVIPISFSDMEGSSFKKVTPKNLDYIKDVFANKTFNSLTDYTTHAISRSELKELIYLKEDLSKIDTSQIKDMSRLFKKATFNGNISNWNVSNVTDMEEMFQGSTFNGDLSNWDVRNVTNMEEMFEDSPLEGNEPYWYIEK